MSGINAADQYLESMVMTASPTRLRLLLICKAVHLCDELLAGDQQGLDAGKTLHLFEIMTELLSGVRADSGEVGKQISDLYLFLLKTLNDAERLQSRQKIAEIRAVLEIEQGTWEQVCIRSNPPLVPPTDQFSVDAGSAGLSLEM